MKIDCGRCVMRGAGCRDCVVAVLEPSAQTDYPAWAPGYLDDAAGYLDEAEVRALGVLATAGMVPPLRLSLPGARIRPEARTWVFPDAKAS